MELHPQVAPLPPRRPVLQDVPLQFHLPKKDAKFQMRQREEDLTWGAENTWHRINEPAGQMTSWHRAAVRFMMDVNTHPHCLAKGILPYSILVCYCFYCLKHSCRLPLIMVASHVAAAVAKALKSRRSMYCPAQCALQRAPCFHPWAPAMNFSNSATDVTEVTGGMEYQPSFTPSSRVGNKKHLRAGDCFFQTRKSFP